MPTILKSENVLDLGADQVVDETSNEHFDRAAFARRAIDLVRPQRTTVAICEGASRLRVESGRVWGRPRATAERGSDRSESDRSEPAERWALLAIPARASRRAIALAVAQLAPFPRAYALDVLMGEADVPPAGSSPEPTDTPADPGLT
jgi:hypothetical protein